MSQKVRVINQVLDNLTSDEIVVRVCSAIEKRRPIIIATVNPEFMVLSSRNEKFARTLSKFDVKTADGTGIVFMSALFGHKFRSRVTGADLTHELIGIANQKRFKVVMLGGSEESALKACNRLRNDYPSLNVDCISGGTINPDRIDDGLIKKIREAKPDILFVGLGSPKQEYFITKLSETVTIPVTMGVGGTIDFISGVARRAPRWMRSMGQEWLWRLVTQPKRFGRIINATIVFPWYYLLWKIKH